MRQPLPPKPEYFDRALASVYTHGGKPMFRVVDGQRETHFFNENPRDIKHWDIDPNGKGRVGRNCWVLEYYQSPAEMSREAWSAARYAEMEVWGVFRWMDVLGPYPEGGRYVHYKDLRDEFGNPLPLTMDIINELRDSVERYMVRRKVKSGDEEIEEFYLNTEAWMEDSNRRYAENFYQAHGLAALSKFHGTEVGRPIAKVFGE